MLTPVNNDTDDAKDTDDYNRVIGIALLKVFSCAKNEAKSKTMKEFDPSLVALLFVKIKNYRADPTTNALNPKALHITCQLHQ